MNRLELGRRRLWPVGTATRRLCLPLFPTTASTVSTRPVVFHVGSPLASLMLACRTRTLRSRICTIRQPCIHSPASTTSSRISTTTIPAALAAAAASQQPQQPQHHQQQQSASSYAHSRHSNDHPSRGVGATRSPGRRLVAPHFSFCILCLGQAAARSLPPQSLSALSAQRTRTQPNYAHWDSQLGSERSHKSRLDLSPSRRPDAPANPSQSQQKPMARTTSAAARRRSRLAPRVAPSVATVRSSHHHRSSSRSNAYDPDADEEYEDEQDELEDDADATREEHDYVLSNPLKLLAQASDAAAARIEGGRVEPGSRSSLAAVETMGLLHPTLCPPTAWLSAPPSISRDSDAAVRAQGRRPFAQLGGLPTAFCRRCFTRIEAGLSSDEAANDASHRSQPPFLKDSMRSKSFPEGELPRIDGPVAMDESDPGVPAAGPSRPASFRRPRPSRPLPWGAPTCSRRPLSTTTHGSTARARRRPVEAMDPEQAPAASVAMLAQPLAVYLAPRQTAKTGRRFGDQRRIARRDHRIACR